MRRSFGSGRGFAAAVADSLDTQLRGGWIEAQSKWEDVRTRWPDKPIGYCGVIVCAREHGRIDYAVEVLKSAQARFPAEPAVISEAAQIAQRLGDWEACAELWKKIVVREDARVEYLQYYAHALFVLGRDEELEAILSVMQARYPECVGTPIALRAMIAAKREDWDSSLALWREYRRLFPKDRTGWDHYGLAYQAKQFALLESRRDEQHIELVDAQAIEVIDDEEMRSLLLAFESIGSDCEFGLVQRRYGAEPLSLLRFNSVDFGSLLVALAQGLENMGAPEHTELITLPNGEFFIRDRRWGLGMHTFIFKWSESSERLYTKFCKRVAFLKDKFLVDLAEARKIFVFMSFSIGLDELLLLHSALRKFGDVALLHVRPAGAQGEGLDSGRAGDVVQVRPGLFVGYLSRLGRDAKGDWNIAFEEWVALCRAAAQLKDPQQNVGSPLS